MSVFDNQFKLLKDLEIFLKEKNCVIDDKSIKFIPGFNNKAGINLNIYLLEETSGSD